MLLKSIYLKLIVFIKKFIPNFKPIIPVYFSIDEFKNKQKSKHPIKKEEMDLLLDFELGRKSYMDINTDAIELYLDECVKNS